MKKYFMFVAVAAAGMLASCSSESLTAGSDPKIEPTQEERVPIQLGVSAPSVNLASGTTRGTGTVGGVGVPNDDPTNVWYGQKINAFMFDKGTLDLAKETTSPDTYFYNDALMITPGTTDNQIPGLSTPTNIGEAMLANGDIKYYPSYGNFDFFGYHGAGAVTGAVDNTTAAATLWTVPFTIDGSNDLMSTKAALQAWGDLTTAQQAKFGGDPTTYAAFSDYYSAKAARKLIQPVLSFNHLLTRLAFEVKAGNDNAGGWPEAGATTFTAATAAAYNATLDGAINAGVALTTAQATAYNTFSGGSKAAGDTLDETEANTYNASLAGAKAAGDAAVQNPKTAVHVKSIEVYSKTTGKMAVAWKNEPANKITWDDNGTPGDASDDGAPAWLALQERPAYYKTGTPTTTISQTAYNALPTSNPGAGGDWQGNYTAVPANNTNYNLVALTPTYPTMSTSGVYPETSVGEALIVAPSTNDYQMKVLVSQQVPTNWKTPGALTEKEQTYVLTIPAPTGTPANGFLANTSYKVVLTVYGFERIEVTTEIIPWTQGSTIPVGED